MLKEFPILYKYTSRGAVQQWQIFVDGDSFYAVEGLKGGKLTQSLPTICKGKNEGKKNATTPEQQALKEAQAKWDKKVASGYNEVLTDEKKFFQPMLARELKDNQKLLFTVPTFIQPKLDGIRAISQNNTLMSRNGKPFITCPHLYQDKYILDGELYNHDYKDNFNEIVSLVKRGNPTEEELNETKEKVQYWIYDYPSYLGVFSERYKAIESLDLKWNSLVTVPTYQVYTLEDIEKMHLNFLEQGFEGSIIRLDLPNAHYEENKRSKQLLKKKDFIDEEFLIVGAEEALGGRAGTIGAFIMQHDKDPNQTFKTNIKGSHEYLRQVWKDVDKYIGTRATVKYFNRTPKKEDGTGDAPRFGFVIKLNREEYE